MADLLRDIGQFLIDNGKATAFGTDLYLEQRPDTPDNIITLYEYAGDPTTTGVDDAVGRNIQVLVRNASYQTARDKVWEIFNLLDRPADRIIKLPDRWMIVTAQQTPFRLNIDAKNRPVYVFNLNIATQRN